MPFFLPQWVANPANDMYADTVTTVILEVQSNPKIHKGIFTGGIINICVLL